MSPWSTSVVPIRVAHYYQPPVLEVIEEGGPGAQGVMPREPAPSKVRWSLTSWRTFFSPFQGFPGLLQSTV